ncbi:uncharacterized protein MYCGRDRAFT_97747 [Zymoseptoria tritici IPO323]|uniref:Uncharacterized protein n=1 Tax=Zymoseptoria tritici (strain CBS 115943 / IPO323) TaxID=336722 RepID=F9XR88_ZYMTI|nr:uncharacterized protein MYCGRDRAFT_97747 [Zymoseptoria tritici IPO323]EGP82253.1 hypothetical protein MYCGRDRAFT_97747 [Zymoseptoria tritici IPO323]
MSSLKREGPKAQGIEMENGTCATYCAVQLSPRTVQSSRVRLHGISRSFTGSRKGRRGRSEEDDYGDSPEAGSPLLDLDVLQEIREHNFGKTGSDATPEAAITESIATLLHPTMARVLIHMNTCRVPAVRV